MGCKTRRGITLITAEVARIAKTVARNLHDFLAKFSCGEADEECIY